VLKHVKFKFFFSVEPNPSIKSMAHVGFNSFQKASSSTFESIKVETKAYSHSNTKLQNNISSKLEPLNFLKPLIKKKPNKFYEKICVF
jgi:hypothetical protein